MTNLLPIFSRKFLTLKPEDLEVPLEGARLQIIRLGNKPTSSNIIRGKFVEITMTTPDIPGKSVGSRPALMQSDSFLIINSESPKFRTKIIEREMSP